MKILRISLIACVLFLTALALLVWFMPARLALAMLGSRMHGMRLEQVDGTLWHGRAAQLRAADGSDLGQLRWTVSRRALLGDLRAHVAFERPGLTANGDMQRISAGVSAWKDVQIHADAAMLDGLGGLDGNRLHGRLDVHIVDARLQGFWPMQLDADAQWRDAAMDDGTARVALGGFQLQAHGQGGIVKLSLRDDGRGPLRADGSAALSPLAWHYRLKLVPGTDNAPLRDWLARFGRLAPDGTLQLHGNGGLTRLMSHTEQ